MSGKLNFSLTQLEYVMAVHNNGHFAKAAQACFVTQPTLSMQIQKLEQDLNVVIFDRSKKPILTTDAGKKVIEQIRKILFEAKTMESLVQQEHSGLSKGELKLAVIPTVAPYLLPRLLPSLEKLFPDIELKIQEMQTSRIVEALNNDEIDVGLLATPIAGENLHEYALFFEPFYVLCKQGDIYADQKKIKYSALSLEEIWLMEEGHCLRNQIVDLCASKKGKAENRKFKFESGSLETLKNLVDSYGGYTLLPQLATEQIGAKSKVIPFERPIPAREIGLVYRREHYKFHLIESLGAAILASLPKDLQKIREKDLNVLPINE